MAKNKIGLQFAGWKEMLSRIEKAAGEAGLKQATEAALKASKTYINDNVDAIMVKGNMPAHGKYWTGDTKASLNKSYDVQWSGFTGAIDIGFDLEKSGLTSIYLMHGTPRHKPPMQKVAGLNEAFYGKKTKLEAKRIQKEAIEKWIERNL